MAGKRLAPRVRAGLWWLVCVRFVMGVVCGPIVPVSIPSFAVPQTTVLHGLVRAAAPPPLSPIATVRPATADPTPTSAVPPVSSEATNPSAPDDKAAIPVSSPAPPRMSLSVWLAGVYFAGLITFVAWGWRATVRLRRVLRASLPIADETTLAAFAEVVSAFPMRTLPQLRESPSVSSPLLAGKHGGAVLLLPVGFAQTTGPTALRLALVHEMAHFQRGDLWLGIIAQAARALFFFFPLAHYACREWEQACEEACDARALALCPHARLSDYGQLLLSFSFVKGSAFVPTACHMAAALGFLRLKRRLQILQREQPQSKAARCTAFMLTLCVAGGAVPLRWTTAEAANLPGDLLQSATGTGATRYEVVEIVPPPSGYSDAWAISDSGQIVGTATGENQNGGQAFVFDAQTGATRAIARDNTPRSLAQAVSANGTVAGWAWSRTSRPVGFVWHDGTRSPRILPSLPGYRYSRATGVSDAGTVVGNVQSGRKDDGATPTRAIVFRSGKLRDLGTLGGPYSLASAITGDGSRVVGKADLPRPRSAATGATHAFLYANGAMRDLGTLPGGTNSRAWGMSATGEIVGFSESANGKQAFVAGEPPGEPMRPLGTLPGREESVAYAVSATGLAVGEALTTGTPENKRRTAVAWERKAGEAGGHIVDLNERIAPQTGWRLLSAHGINKNGWIVGQGLLRGKKRAFLLKPLAASPVAVSATK